MVGGRFGPVLHRNLNKRPLEAERSYKARIVTTGADAGGHHIWDLSSGAGITCLGHSINEIKGAMREQIAECPYLHSGSFTHRKIEELAARLLSTMEHASFEDGAVMFLNSGAEAVEAACKLAIQYYAERKAGMPYLYAREGSYHGNTLFTLALGDHPRRQSWTVYLPYGYIRRLPLHDPRDPVRDEFAALERAGADKIPFVVVIEPVAGTTAGIICPADDYLARLRAICNQYGALLIYDEVLCGNNRFGTFFAHNSFAGEVAPDICCIGKGLTGGYFPLSAVICSGKVVQALVNGSQRLWHSTTNQNHPIGCAAGVAALSQYDHFHKQRQTLVWFLAQEVNKLREVPAIASVGGAEMLYGLRLHKEYPQQTLREIALRNGVALYGDSTCNMVLLAPPYCITVNELQEACGTLGKVLMEWEGQKQKASA
jgi:hypothetical protein